MPRDKSATRERLLTAAAELTYAHGVTAVGVDAIAARAGVTKRTLYQHFRSKDELIGASLAARDGPAVASLRAAVERRAARDGSPPVLALFDVLERLFRAPWWQGCAFQNAALELAGESEHPAHAAMASHGDGRRALVGDLLRASGIEDDDLADEIALIVEGAFAVSGTRRDPRAARVARRAVERLLND